MGGFVVNRWMSDEYPWDALRGIFSLPDRLREGNGTGLLILHALLVFYCNCYWWLHFHFPEFSFAFLRFKPIGLRRRVNPLLSFSGVSHLGRLCFTPPNMVALTEYCSEKVLCFAVCLLFINVFSQCEVPVLNSKFFSTSIASQLQNTYKSRI